MGNRNHASHSGSSQTAAGRLRDDALFLVLVLLIAAFVRLDFLIANNFVIDADEAIVGLMATHILDGKGIPAFYYGQHYMGSLEALLASALFLVFGVSSAALKCVPLLFSLLFIVLIYQIGLELGSRKVARVAAILAAVPPQVLVIWSAMARGGFMEVVCIGAMASILTLRWIRLAVPPLSLTAAIWILLGLGWWTNNQIVFFALPVTLCFLLLAVRSDSVSWLGKGKHALVALAGFLFGGLPFWLYNLRHSFASFEIVKTAPATALWEHVEGLLTTALPMLLGARRQWHDEDVFPGAAVLVGLLYFGLLLFLKWSRRAELMNLLRLRLDRRAPLEFFLLLLLVTFAVFVTSSYGSLVASPRYLLPTYVSIFVLTSVAIVSISASSRRLGALLFSVILLINLASLYLGGRAIPGEPFVFRGERVSKDQGELLNWLIAQDVSLVRTNYWIGYRLAFESREKVRFSLFHTPDTARIPEYEQAAAQRDQWQLPLVLVPAQGRLVTRALEAQGYGYKKEILSGYWVIYDIRSSQTGLQAIDSSALRAGASDNAAAAALAVDGAINTRWGSARPQAPGMQFEVELREPTSIRSIQYDLGAWPHDEARELSIDVELADGQRRTILAPDDYPAVRYLREDSSHVAFYFEPLSVRRVIFTQQGSQQIFDWSLAEVQVLQ